jgi:multisite-specific tRNA:(cytosine-C5)-methyltransferase
VSESSLQSQRLVPEDEWEAFLNALRDPLPTTFRINPMTGFHELVQQQLRSPDCFGLASRDISYRGAKPAPPSPLPWYPGSMAWYYRVSRMDLRRTPGTEQLRQFLMMNDEQGNISRQEVGQMRAVPFAARVYTCTRVTWSIVEPPG